MLNKIRRILSNFTFINEIELVLFKKKWRKKTNIIKQLLEQFLT